MPEPMGGGVFRSQPITSVPAKRNGASKPFWRWPIDGVDGEEGGGLMMSSGLEFERDHRSDAAFRGAKQ